MENTYIENIKFLIKEPKTPIIKPDMHRSIFADSIKKDYKTKKYCHKTMGYAKTPLNPPTDFLKKHSRVVTRPYVEIVKKNMPQKPTKHHFVACGSMKHLPINIIRENIIKTKHMVPPLPKPQIQDTRNGHLINVLPSYVSKRGYGKTPEYLVEFKKSKEIKIQTELARKQAIKPPLRCLPEEERRELLNGLKANWAELQKEYLLMPIITETISKINRKIKLEKQLNTLEKDMLQLERNQAIYVCQDM